jgi:hemerythrin
MSTLTWSEGLVTDLAPMDRTHREFVDLLADMETALDDDPERVPSAYEAFVVHTEEHFAQEERWMATVGFSAENCHAFQHRHVLEVLREVRGVIGTTGDAQILRRLLAELSQWFPAHAQMMDQALADTLNQLGFDEHTGQFSRPLVNTGEPVTHCGSAGCS